MSESASTDAPGKGGGVLGRFKRPQQPQLPEVSDAPQMDTDLTTGLPARSNLAPWAKSAIKRSHASSTRAVVAFIGVGLLRDINDAFGADAGDKLLRLIGDRLQSIDMPGTRVVRYDRAASVVLAVSDNSDPARASGFMAWLEKAYGRDITTRSWLTVQRIVAKLES